MKSEKQFLEDIWANIDLIEQEELQKQIAREKTIKQIKQNTIKYLCTILFFVLLSVIIIFDRSNLIKIIILPLSLILLVLGYFLENPLQQKIIVLKGVLMSWIQ